MILIPDRCPSCEGKLELVNEQLFCYNKTCPAQTLKKIQHFCKVMGIKGMGEKTLEKLDFETYRDIYSFSESYFVDTLGETLGRKLFKEIRKSAEVPLNTGLAAFGIPLIGETAAKKLGAVCKSLDDICEETCKLAGLGEKATNNLMDWICSEDAQDLPINTNFEVVNDVAPTSSNGVTVCITGKLNNYKNRSDAAKYLESLGYKVVDSVTKSTNILIDEEGKQSSKRSKAEQLNIPIMSIEELVKGN